MDLALKSAPLEGFMYPHDRVPPTISPVPETPHPAHVPATSGVPSEEGGEHATPLVQRPCELEAPCSIQVNAILRMCCSCP